MFEVKATDLAGRIGRLKTKSGILETPALLPVVHPTRQEVPPEHIRKLGFDAVMTNAYLALKNRGENVRKKGIHRTIEFDGVVMTDSGGYQVLEYGDVNVSVESMALFQEEIGSDIAVVLDKPTGSKASRRYAEQTVSETLKAAEKTLEVKSRSSVLWTGPIQGGAHLDLVEKSAEETGKMNFDIYALGSPTEVMESYNFRLLTAMVMAAKRNIPIEKPLHLFGAGHPLTIPLAVALGCDLFDSASYMLYAREDRYLTDSGTVRLKELTYLNCVCPVCTSHSPQDLMKQEKSERSINIAIHNLHILLKAVKESKEAIRAGRLWEHLGAKARCHPRLWEAFNGLEEYSDFLEDGVPLFKSKAVFFMSSPDYVRPEVMRYRTRLIHDVELKKPTLLLLPETEVRPFYKSQLYSAISKTLDEKLKDVQICFLAHPLGAIPVELSDIYPLAQYESAVKPDAYTGSRQAVVDDIERMVKRNRFSEVVMLVDGAYSRGVASELGKMISIRMVEAEEDLLMTSEKVASKLQKMG